MITLDAKTLSAVRIPWFTLQHSGSVTHTATGSHLLAVVTVLVRRNERVDPQVSVLYGEETVLKSEGRVWLNNLPPGELTHSFIEIFSGRVEAGASQVTVTTSAGTRLSGEYRFDCRTYRNVARAGAFTPVYGTESGTEMRLAFASAAGRRSVVAFAHESRAGISAFTGGNATALDLFLAISEGVVGDVEGAKQVVVTARRSSGKHYCGAALDLIEHVDSNAARITLTGATPSVEVVPPPPVSKTSVPVLTLDPAFNKINPNHLRGELFRAPYVPVKVPYTNWPGNANAKGGRDKLDEFLHKYAGTKVLVVGHSMGGQVVCKWLREKGPTSDIDPSEVTFIITGNLERKYNGLPGGGDYPGGSGGTGIPANTRYRVIDIARQYDFFADYPNSPNAAAMRNIDPKGSGLGLGSPVHTNYTTVSANPASARNFSITEGNVTYMWSPTYPAPLIDDEDFFATSETLEPRDDLVRAEIEAAYARPVAIPPPPPGGDVFGQFPWGWDGSQWVRVPSQEVDAQPSPSVFFGALPVPEPDPDPPGYESGLNEPFLYASEKAGATISVLTYGATINNSSNDDRPAFTAAIAAASPGDEVFIPNGNYHFKGSQAVNLKAGVKIRGESTAGVIINTQYTAQAHSVFYCGANQDDIILEGFTIVKSSGSDFLAGIRFSDFNGSATTPAVQRAIIRNVVIRNHQRFGVEANNVKHLLVENSTISDAVALDGGGSGYGVLLGGPQTSNCWVRNNTVGPVIRHALLCQQSHHNLLEYNDITGCVSGAIDMHGHGEHRNEICHNTIHDNVRDGTSVSPNGAGVEVGEPPGDHDSAGPHNWIHHNTIYNCPQGVRVMNKSNFTYIEDNAIYDCDDGVLVDQQPGFPLTGVSDVVIDRNTITDCGIGVHLIDGVAWPLVRGNTISDCTTGILTDDATTGYVVSGNVMSGNGTDVVLGSGDGTYVP